MSPLPNARVIPPLWAQHHAEALRGTRTAEAVFFRSGNRGPAPFPRPADWADDGTIIHRCTVRVSAAAGSGNTLAGMQPTSESAYAVMVPLEDMPPELRTGEKGDVIRVMGKVLRVVRDEASSNELERRLVCVENLSQRVVTEVNL